jgi:NADH:ubiquinone oxidoreductase subunit H
VKTWCHVGILWNKPAFPFNSVRPHDGGDWAHSYSSGRFLLVFFDHVSENHLYTALFTFFLFALWTLFICSPFALESMLFLIFCLFQKKTLSVLIPYFAAIAELSFPLSRVEFFLLCREKCLHLFLCHNALHT